MSFRKAPWRKRSSPLFWAAPPAASRRFIASLFNKLQQQIESLDASTTKVVVFGGGTGLSNIIGGDSRRLGWARNPFTGLKQVFPQVNSVVCVTDDGGSTGELQKDLPLIALGDLRHVLISSIRRENLIRNYGLDRAGGPALRSGVACRFQLPLYLPSRFGGAGAPGYRGSPCRSARGDCLPTSPNWPCCSTPIHA